MKRKYKNGDLLITTSDLYIRYILIVGYYSIEDGNGYFNNAYKAIGFRSNDEFSADNCVIPSIIIERHYQLVEGSCI